LAALSGHQSLFAAHDAGGFARLEDHDDFVRLCSVEVGKQIEGVLAAQKDMEEITAKLPDNPTPDKITAQLDGVARKNGFASYDEYTNVVDNISIVLAGIDPATKQYVGTDAVIKAQIAQDCAS
jgi:hypothetical protein